MMIVPSPLRYAGTFVLSSLAAAAPFLPGAASFSLPLLAFVVIPLIELRARGDGVNPDGEGERHALHRRAYDAILFAQIPIHLFAVIALLVRADTLSGLAWIGSVTSVGISCGAFAINVAHELGHRRERLHRALARLLLASTLYDHFYVEHNRGHHMRVATHDDPASARFGEALYPFFWRSIVGSFRSAWSIEAHRLARERRPAWSFRNEVLQGLAVEGTLIVLAVTVVGAAAFTWLAASVIGVLLLETVNYIEHYGLVRADVDGRPERVRPQHSWNSDHPLSRIFLFELSRHSDHHAFPLRPYPLLRHTVDAPQLPTGYAGMVLLATFPPAFFAVMNHRVPRAVAAAA
jgi:alkane 1-monooxygenase